MTKVIKSSGNIYKDLGFKNPEEEIAKADLDMKIIELIRSRNLTQVKAARILKIDQPKVSALQNGRLKDFSISRLLRYLTLLDQNIQIVIKDRTQVKSDRHISVVSVCQ
jgi:predicted XRE-type DNA-binding protein